MLLYMDQAVIQSFIGLFEESHGEARDAFLYDLAHCSGRVMERINFILPAALDIVDNDVGLPPKISDFPAEQWPLEIFQAVYAHFLPYLPKSHSATGA